jgi:hypothetical protein
MNLTLPAAANADRADPLPVDKRLGAQLAIASLDAGFCPRLLIIRQSSSASRLTAATGFLS